jgi:DegV family protein with EDD domain
MILTDSTADLSPEYQIKEDVQSIPLFIRFDEDVYKDGIDITPSELYERVKTTKEIARSTGLRSGDFHNAFSKFIKRGYDIVYIGIGSNLSSTIQSAMIARQELETKQVFIVDSKSISAGLALLVERAVQLRNEGKSALQIKKALDELVPRLHFYYILSDLDLLKHNYRMKSFKFRVALLFKSKPIVKMINDRIELYKHPFGKLENKINTLVRLVEKQMKHHEMTDLVITHSTDEKTAQFGYDQVINKLHPKKISMYTLGCVLGAQIGEHAFGFAYIVKDSTKKG